MPSDMRPFVGAALVSLAAATSAAAQASPYLPVDDTRLPLLEHLIARGDVQDPSPMIRPFRVADALRVLAAADTAPSTPNGRDISALRKSLQQEMLEAEAWWRVEVRVGGEAYTQKRLDLLHLGGPGAENPYFDLALRGAVGKIAFATRPSVEPSLIGNPDWPNTAQENITGRLVEGYLSAQFKMGSLTYGQLEQNWGPVGLPGIPLSDYGFQRQGLGLEIGTKDVRLNAFASDLRTEIDSVGQNINRYLIVHRLGARFSQRLDLALWEAIIISGNGRVLETPFANPLSPSVLANTFGVEDLNSNDMIGLDMQWRAVGRINVTAQLALDDFLFNKRYQAPDRWALTVGAFGPLGARASWRALYTQVSSLALRTFDAFENFTDAGVGTGRNFSDMDLALLTASAPVKRAFLVSAELAVQRQGEGRIDAPFPARNAEGNIDVPGIFIGTVEHTYRIGLGVTGRYGPVDINGNAGLNHVTNDQNRLGVTANRFVGRIRVTLALSRRGVLK